MEKDEIEKFYEDSLKRLEKEYNSSNSPDKEEKYKEKCRIIREKYTLMYKNYIEKESQKTIKEIRFGKKKGEKKEETQKEEIEKFKKWQYKRDLLKFKIRVRLRRIYEYLSLYKIIFLFNRIHTPIASEISYGVMVISHYSKRKANKIANKTKSITKSVITKLKEAYHKIIAVLKKPFINNKKDEKSAEDKNKKPSPK